MEKNFILQQAFLILLVIVALAVPAMATDGSFAVSIQNPSNTTYNTTAIPVSISSNQSIDSLFFKVDGANETAGCFNCSTYSQALNLSVGQHQVSATGTLGNETITHDMWFTIALPVVNQTNQTNGTDEANQTNGTNTNQTSTTFALRIVSPTARNYFNGYVPVLVRTNVTVDRIVATIGDGSAFNATCQNCSVLSTYAHLATGNYTLYTTAASANVSIEKDVIFSVMQNPGNQTNWTNYNWMLINRTGGFGKGFEKLPQMFLNGNLTDHDLAAIILANKLNPGILNRLIKSGKLGNESLSAILDSQFQPKGIMRKLLDFIGMHLSQDDYASMIKQYYPLTKNLKQKLVQRDDLPANDRKQLQKELSDEIDKETHDGQQGTDEPGNDFHAGYPGNRTIPPNDSQGRYRWNLTANETLRPKDNNQENQRRVLNIGSQQKDNRWIPPGQVRRIAGDNSDSDNAKGSPTAKGQIKKMAAPNGQPLFGQGKKLPGWARG